ncbi:hypothetical protein RN001_013066 [Aquatica leii]|uniref:Beta-glucuronidase n=1 Tax=Aquatica leii TaxID=1421715 RepID=A0AAN7S6T8_9COLE|nr:hypothetical protein RN001_013066 [Aquatica leii]
MNYKRKSCWGRILVLDCYQLHNGANSLNVASESSLMRSTKGVKSIKNVDLLDIWCQSKKSNKTLAVIEKLYSLLALDECPDDFRKELMTTSRQFCLNMNNKWKEVSRSRKRLLEHHEAWIQQIQYSSTELSKPGPKRSRGRPMKPFNEALLKTKKRRLAELAASRISDEMQFAVEMIRVTTEIEAETSSLTPSQALALYLDLDLSENKYKVLSLSSINCILYPRESETREVVRLDGLWNFLVDSSNDSCIRSKIKWFEKDLSKLNDVEIHKMPVPSSYNDITTNIKIRDHVGVVWYDRTFFVPENWNAKNVFLRFSSVNYAAQVWVNGKQVIQHDIGHLPFENEVSSFLNFGKNNIITVSCNNTLSNDTVPQGYVEKEDTDYGPSLIQHYTFDFFNYAGIHRSVFLYTTPKAYIRDIAVTTDVSQNTGFVHYVISHLNKKPVNCIVTLLDKLENTVVVNNNSEGVLEVKEAKLWWPYLMDPNAGYLYTLKVELHNSDGKIIDVYRQPIGIRSISWTNTTLMLNNRPIYFHGFGKHEDSDMRGKGFDWPVVIRDYNLIKWIGGNSFRTSHYPYADEIMDLADELGIMVIDECPSVDTELFSSELLENHKRSLTELYNRDKNRPSVIMWSIANEPRTQSNAASDYFKKIANHIKTLDKTRPVTLAFVKTVEEDKVGSHVDVISFNRYNAWYKNSGNLNMIVKNVVDEATAWHKKYNKPVLMTEYGADAVAGLHIYPEYIWSEEFQLILMENHFKAFDILRKEDWFVGEFIWNFADFKTAQTFKRVGGNKKGIFTRDRQPKASAHHLRRRYNLLAQELYDAPLPSNFEQYFLTNAHNEL